MDAFQINNNTNSVRRREEILSYSSHQAILHFYRRQTYLRGDGEGMHLCKIVRGIYTQPAQLAYVLVTLVELCSFCFIVIMFDNGWSTKRDGMRLLPLLSLPSVLSSADRLTSLNGRDVTNLVITKVNTCVYYNSTQKQ